MTNGSHESPHEEFTPRSQSKPIPSSQISVAGLILGAVWIASALAVASELLSMNAFVEWIRSLQSDSTFLPRAIFSAWAVTAMTYGLSLGYFRGLFGFATTDPIWWDSDTLGWLLGIFGALASIGLALLAIPTAPFWTVVLFIILMIVMVLVFFGLILMLAKHDLPPWLFWTMFGLLAAIIVFAIILTLILGGGSPPAWAASILVATIVAFILAIYVLALILAYKLGRAIGRSLPNSAIRILFGWMPWGPYVPLEKETGGVNAYPDKGTVDNPTGALPDPTGTPGAGQRAIIHPGAWLVVDFGSRKIADHWNTADLRIIRANTDVSISVEVGNDGTNWESCDHETGSDWDVPWYNSPFRYVRICNTGNSITGVSDVFDLDP